MVKLTYLYDLMDEEFPMNVIEIRRPADMERITTPELAQAFIEEQVALIREQVGDKKVLLVLSGGAGQNSFQG